MASKDSNSGGAKLSRTETITIRLDPKTRYLAELASRIHRRTLSSYVEWAISESLSHVTIPGTKDTIAELSEALWDVDEPDRFVHLATRYPTLLTHEEQRRWKLIRENGALWHGDFEPRWTWNPYRPDTLVLATLRKHWAQFVAVSKDEAPASVLPTWLDERPAQPRPSRAKPSSIGDAEFDGSAGVFDDDDLPF